MKDGQRPPAGLGVGTNPDPIRAQWRSTRSDGEGDECGECGNGGEAATAARR